MQHISIFVMDASWKDRTWTPNASLISCMLIVSQVTLGGKRCNSIKRQPLRLTSHLSLLVGTVHTEISSHFQQQPHFPFTSLVHLKVSFAFPRGAVLSIVQQSNHMRRSILHGRNKFFILAEGNFLSLLLVINVLQKNAIALMFRLAELWRHDVCNSSPSRAF